MPRTQLECRYCDGGFRPILTPEGDEQICNNCGAVWDPIQVTYTDDEIAELERELAQYDTYDYEDVYTTANLENDYSDIEEENE